MRLRSAANDTRRGAAGAALVELVVVLPVLLLLMVGAADFARVFYNSMVLTNAARAGAQWGTSSAANSANSGMMESTALSAATAANLSGVSAVATRLCECVSDTSAGTRSSALCTATCSSGSHLEYTVSVTVSRSFSTVAPYPGVPRPVALSRTVLMRAQ